jgi:1-deoxy-D-xylulose-5-phosphate reductoisomerase
VKRVVVLGSTGSVGTQTLQVIERFPERLCCVGLAAGRNVDLVVQQAKQFRPDVVSVARPEDVERVRAALDDPSIEVCSDSSRVATADANLVIAALVGGVGMRPVLAALANGTDVALANKEVLVMAGALVLKEAQRSGARLIPLDSEHVAIHQCLAGHPVEALRKVTLTASGGPFRTASVDEIARARPAEALAHPNWDMGPKITIDSATLMNKGFEVIEARWLFDLDPEQIDVVIHPESIIHSLVEFCDGSWLAQLAVPDMRVPIAYALGLPERLPLSDLEPLDLVQIGALHFEAPDHERFPALHLAQEALLAGGTAPAALSAANEIAVEAFLAGRIPFTGIARAAETVLRNQTHRPGLELEEILVADREAREAAGRWVEEHTA